VISESKQVDFILKTEQPVFNMSGHLLLQANDRGTGHSPGTQA